MKASLLNTISVVGLMLVPWNGLNAQERTILTPEAFISQIRQHHPVAKQANLITEKAAAELLQARGAFDPALAISTDNKSLDGVGYYHYTHPELKIPTAAGVVLKSGFEKSTGRYINPELTQGVASYLGLEVPLLSGLLIDKRRAVLQQAKIYCQQSQQERQILLNDLLFEAYDAYWQWAGAYQVYSVYRRYWEVAERRARLVSIAFQNGDRAVADTIEAFAQLQNYRLLQSEALMQLNDRTLDLSLYLWTNTQEPYLLSPTIQPDTALFVTSFLLPDTTDLASQLSANHPALRTSQYKQQGLQVERKLTFQQLLPSLNVQANVLSKEYFDYKNLSAYYLANNYKFGLNVKVPLLFRQGRGAYKSAQIKIRDAQLELSNKSWELQTKVRQYYNEAFQLKEQIRTATAMYQTYSSLLRIEELKFSQGESSLFLVNSRETKALEMQQKVIELRAKYMKAVFAIQWALGVIR